MRDGGELMYIRQGLPREWQSLLKASGITRQEVLANPHALLNVLEFNQNYYKYATHHVLINFIMLIVL